MIIKTSIPGLADSLVIPLQNKVNELNKEIIDINQAHEQEIFQLTKEHDEYVDALNTEHETQLQNLNNNINDLNTTITNLDSEIKELNTELDYYKLNRYQYVIDNKNYSQPIPNLVGDYPMYIINDDTQSFGYVNIDISHYGKYNYLDKLEKYISLMYGSNTVFINGNITLELQNCTTIGTLLNTLGGATVNANRDIIPLNIKLITSDKLNILDRTFSGASNLHKVNITNTQNLKRADQLFRDCRYIKELDLTECDFSKLESLRSMFSYCYKLDNLQCPSISLAQPTDTSTMYEYCQNLKHPIIPNLSKVLNMQHMFSNCSSIEELGDLNTESCKQFDYSLNCSQLVKVSSIDMRNAQQYFLFCNKIRYIVLKNLVSGKTTTQVAFQWDYWGVEDESIPLSKGARQSLIDTFTKYSFDRATADYPACRIILSKTSLGLFTEEEIAQATARGYTLLS